MSRALDVQLQALKTHIPIRNVYVMYDEARNSWTLQLTNLSSEEIRRLGPTLKQIYGETCI